MSDTVDAPRQIAWTGTPRSYVVNAYGEKDINYEEENRREIPLTGDVKPITVRVVGPADGLSKSYVFGKNGKASFVQEMTAEDASALLSGPSGENFKDVTHDDGFIERTYLPVSEIKYPIADR